MNKVRIFAVCIGLLMACMGAFASTQGDSTRAFFLIGTGATLALLVAASAGPPRPPGY